MQIWWQWVTQNDLSLSPNRQYLFSRVVFTMSSQTILNSLVYSQNLRSVAFYSCRGVAFIEYSEYAQLPTNLFSHSYEILNIFSAYIFVLNKRPGIGAWYWFRKAESPAPLSTRTTSKLWFMHLLAPPTHRARAARTRAKYTFYRFYTAPCGAPSVHAPHATPADLGISILTVFNERYISKTLHFSDFEP